MATFEIVICQCLVEHNLDGDIICPNCNRELLTLKTLQTRQTEIDSLICALKVESASISVEIYLRKIRHPSRPFLIENDLAWLRRQGKPFLNNPRQATRQAALPEINLADFD